MDAEASFARVTSGLLVRCFLLLEVSKKVFELIDLVFSLYPPLTLVSLKLFDFLLVSFFH